MQPYKVWLVQDLIEKNRRQFKIPVYQRNYDWTNVECEKLYSDIIEAFDDDKKHFTGTIVYIHGDNISSRLNEDLIIDGQQRVTTVFIMLKALFDVSQEKNETRIIEELSDYLFNRNCDEQYKLKLKPVEADDLQFSYLMNEEKECLDPSSNIIANYKLFVKLIQESVGKGYLLGDVLEGMKKLEVVEIVLDVSQGDDPQTIFESINSTGLPLSLADLIRNYILMNEKDQDRLFKEYWLPMEKLLGSQLLADYFTHYLNYKLTDAVNNKNAYSKFKKLFWEQGYSHESMLKELKKYSLYYAVFTGKENSYSKKINSYMNDFRAIDQSTIYPFFFALFCDMEDGIIAEDELDDILALMISYCTRRLICEVPSNSLRGFFKTLYNRLYSESKSNYYDKLYAFLSTLKTKDHLIGDQDFLEKLIFGQLYTKKKACKFVLAKIENYESHEPIDTSDMSIEHIMPQKENSVIWKQEIGVDYPDVYNKYLHTLGNLTITGYNSELGTKSFLEKKKIIAEYSHAVKLNEYILNQTAWGERQITDRAKKLGHDIIDILSFRSCDLDIESINNNVDDKLYLDSITADEIKGTTPKMFSLCGEDFEVNTYQKMLSSFMNVIYDLEPKIITNLAKNRFQVTNSDRYYISYDSSELRRCKEIHNSGIYYEINLSAWYILQFIKVMLDEYDLDYDDFNFSLKS